jgi:hypothetical protein
MDLNVHGIAWLGVRTERRRETAEFFGQVLGIPEGPHRPGVSVFKLPNGDTIEVFDPDDPEHAHFTTGPVAGFLVADVEVARAELERAGVELIGPVGRAGGMAWAHFRGPDGNVYELTEDANRDPGGFMADLPG